MAASVTVVRHSPVTMETTLLSVNHDLETAGTNVEVATQGSGWEGQAAGVTASGMNLRKRKKPEEKPEVVKKPRKAPAKKGKVFIKKY